MQKNTKHKPESIQKMRLSHLGMRWTEEAKRKNSESHKLMWQRLKNTKQTKLEIPNTDTKKAEPEKPKPSFSRLVFSIKNK